MSHVTHRVFTLVSGNWMWLSASAFFHQYVPIMQHQHQLLLLQQRVFVFVFVCLQLHMYYRVYSPVSFGKQ